MQNFYLFLIQAGPKVIKIAVSQLQFFFWSGEGPDSIVLQKYLNFLKIKRLYVVNFPRNPKIKSEF